MLTHFLHTHATINKRVDTLKVLVTEAWTRCLWEYVQLAILRLVDPQYSQKFIANCLNDYVEFNNFMRQLNDDRFRSRRVYRAWYYIRPLVMKYLPEGTEEIYKDLDKVLPGPCFLKLVGGLPKATPKKERPEKMLSKEQWNTLSRETRNRVLNDVVEKCGYKKVCRDWEYEDVFVSVCANLEAC